MIALMKHKIDRETLFQLLCDAEVHSVLRSKVLEKFDLHASRAYFFTREKKAPDTWTPVFEPLKRELRAVRTLVQRKTEGSQEHKAFSAYLSVLQKLLARLEIQQRQLVRRQDYVQQYQIPNSGSTWMAFVPERIKELVRAEFNIIPVKKGVRRKIPFQIDARTVRLMYDRKERLRYQLSNAIEHGRLLNLPQEREDVLMRAIERLDSPQFKIPPSTYFQLLTPQEREVLSPKLQRIRKKETAPRKPRVPRRTPEDQGL